VTSRTAELRSESRATEFYEARYSQGYMDQWPTAKKQRVFALIRALNLPPVGTALDFGCGNGVFTDVLRQALGPSWTVVGTDVSTVALDNARARFPDCKFVAAESLQGAGFDFFFSHHVLEHVFDLAVSLRRLDQMVAAESTGLHILPCGNPGSFEHWLATLRHDGIDPAMGNRFFHDDEGHVRRLRTEELAGLYEALGFTLAAEFYAGHRFSTLDWLSTLGPERPLEMAAPSFARDHASRWTLRWLRVGFLLLWMARHPAPMLEEKLRKTNRSVRDVVLMVAALPVYPLSKIVDAVLRWASAREWSANQRDSRGTEMYLVFRRVGARKDVLTGSP
jgi:SAM-dependent methyltransferase